MGEIPDGTPFSSVVQEKLLVGACAEGGQSRAARHRSSPPLGGKPELASEPTKARIDSVLLQTIEFDNCNLASAKRFLSTIAPFRGSLLRELDFCHLLHPPSNSPFNFRQGNPRDAIGLVPTCVAILSHGQGVDQLRLGGPNSFARELLVRLSAETLLKITHIRIEGTSARYRERNPTLSAGQAAEILRYLSNLARIYLANLSEGGVDELVKTINSLRSLDILVFGTVETGVERFRPAIGCQSG